MSVKGRIIPVFVPHLGCPRGCVFCNQRRISGSLSQPDAAAVAETIREGILKNPEGSNIELAFYGGSFTAIPTEKQCELLGAALPFLRAGQISSIRLSTRPDAIDEEILSRLRDYGVTTIELGSQSMIDEVLELSKRGHTARQTEHAARLIKEHGFKLVLQMMTGLPGDTKERCIETAKRIIALEPDGVRIYPTVIVSDTELCDMWRRGEYDEHTVEEAVDYCSAILPLFEEAGIAVIRLGLNPTEELSAGAALGGAYHPALGELVRSRIMLNRARTLLKDRELGESLVLEVNPAQLSQMIGQGRKNVDILKAEFGFSSVFVKGVDTPKGNILIK